MKSHPFRLTPYALLLTFLFVSAAGAGWVRQTSNTTLGLWDICFVDSLSGWAVGGRSSPFRSDTTLGICLRTTDGGDTWTTVYDTTGRSMMLSVSFANRSRGWMMGDSSFSLTTTDGGATWTVLPQVGTYFSAFALRFVNDTLGYLVGGDFFGGIMEGSVLFRSTNAGTNWSWFGHYKYGQWLFALDVCGPRWAWSLGRYDTLFRTNDAGNSWQSRPFSFPSRYFYGIAFSDTNLGISVSSYQSSIIRTSDGGVSWTERPCPTTRSLAAAEMSGL